MSLKKEKWFVKNVKVALAFVLALGSASLSGCSSVPENVSVEE